MPVTELHIEGLRTIEKVRLRLDGLTVLIGDNGTGKSSILEALEILRRATGPRFLDELYGIHGGLTSLLREGAPRLRIGVRVQRPEDKDIEAIEYTLIVNPDGSFATLEETIRIVSATRAGRPRKGRPGTGKWVVVANRRADRVRTPFDDGLIKLDVRSTFLATKAEAERAWADVGDEAAWHLAQCLKAIRVHVPFETIPGWVSRALDRKSALRTSSLLTPSDHLERLGLNLASSYHALKNNFGRVHWDQTLSYIRLGLGERIEDIVTWVDPGGGNIGLSLKMLGLDRAVPSAQLSDGMLSYLAFVALFRLHTTKPSLVAFDEPDLHLHPQLLMRVLDMFASMAREHPVLLATHSDRLLDGLPDPARSVVLCELDERGATRLVRPDRDALDKWLTRYRGLGDIRGAGHAASVLTKVEPSE